jgi:hypothetical protein
MTSIHKVVGMDPLALQNEGDWLSVWPYLGQAKGGFLANVPSSWFKDFANRQDLAEICWRGLSRKAIIERLTALKNENGLIAVPHERKPGEHWEDIAPKVLGGDEHSVLVGKRGNQAGIPTFDDLAQDRFEADNSAKPRTTDELVRILSPFLQNAGRVAFVDRHQYLDQRAFTKLMRKVVSEVTGKACHEIIIYAKHDPNRQYMSSLAATLSQMKEAFRGLKLPSYGIRYLSCDENVSDRPDDLHARRIVTNFCLITLQDSLAGWTRSQSISRQTSRELLLLYQHHWLEGNHGLKIVIDARLEETSPT